jgi:hypothetical protein
VSGSNKPIANAYCELSIKELGLITRIVTGRVEGGADALAELLEGCLIYYHQDLRIRRLVDDTIRHHQQLSLEFFLSRLRFNDADDKDTALSFHLAMALHHSNMQAAEMLLRQIGRVRNTGELWIPPAEGSRAWDLEELKVFAFHNRGRLLEITPDYPILDVVERPGDAVLLIELASFCKAMSILEGTSSAFDPTWFLFQLLRHDGILMDDAGKADVARCLVQEGADPDFGYDFCLGNPEGLEATCSVILEAKARADDRLQDFPHR